jgi:hypothetical protein
LQRLYVYGEIRFFWFFIFYYYFIWKWFSIRLFYAA